MVPAGVELMLGMVRDDQFGPLVLLGFGGVAVEALNDTVSALPPFDAAHARRLIDRLRLRPLLSVTRGRPASFPLNRVIKGWTEGVQLMVEGEKRRFWIPAALAYGENPPPGAPAGMLVFDVELLKILN